MLLHEKGLITTCLAGDIHQRQVELASRGLAIGVVTLPPLGIDGGERSWWGVLAGLLLRSVYNRFIGLSVVSPAVTPRGGLGARQRQFQRSVGAEAGLARDERRNSGREAFWSRIRTYPRLTG